MYMENVFHKLRNIIEKVINENVIYGDQSEISNFQFELPKNLKYGDISCNIIMLLKRNIHQKKIETKCELEEITSLIISNITNNFKNNIKKIDFVEPGFLNIYFANDFLLKYNERIINNQFDFQKFFSKEEISKTIHLEYGSVNPTGPIHMGHMRGIIIASAFANLCEFIGFKVHREYFYNDSGNQIKELIKSVYLRTKEMLKLDNEEEKEEVPYKGEYIKELVPEELTYSTVQNMDFEEFYEKYHMKTLNTLFSKAKLSLKELSIEFDHFQEESSLYKVKELEIEILKRLQNAKLLAIIESQKSEEDLTDDFPEYNGDVNDIPKNNKIILLSKKLNLEKNKVLRRGDGEWTYFSSDLFYMCNKYKRGFHNQICFLGQDHTGHLSMLYKTFSIIFPEVDFKVLVVNYVRILDAEGNLMKMSKRLGTFLSLDEVVEKYGKNFLKILLSARGHNSILEFSLNDLKNINATNNYGFYFQYAYARICAVLRRVPGHLIERSRNMNQNDAIELNESEKAICRHLMFFEHTIISTYKEIDIHKVFTYLLQVTKIFHSYWQEGKDNSTMRFITDDENTTCCRIYILLSLKKIFEVCLANFFKMELSESL